MDRMTLSLDIRANEIGEKQINVRSSLMLTNLIANIQDKFNLDGTMELTLDGQSEPLNQAVSIEQSGVGDGNTLICDRRMESTGTLEAIQRGVREKFGDQFKRIYLHEMQSLTEYDLAWQPAIIGRRDYRNPSNNRLLAVDLDEVEDLPTVSRHHACISLHDGAFFLETVQARNPTILDGVHLKPGIRYPLAAGAVLQVGAVSLTFYIVS
jgi:hypothetical protein